MKFERKSFIDIHTHILPGLDDGAKDMDESLELARCYQRAGITKVVATPHFLPGTSWSAGREKVLETVAALQEQLDGLSIDLQILPGMEVGYHKKMADRIGAGLLLPLGDSEYYLIEPSFHGDQDIFLDHLGGMLREGHKLIVAHPERIEGLQQTDRLIKLVEHGLLLQINAGSLLGGFGRKSLQVARDLFSRGCGHFIASDTHDTRKRPPLGEQAFEKLLAIEDGASMLATGNMNLTRIFPS